jgi:hypothetical protein
VGAGESCGGVGGGCLWKKHQKGGKAMSLWKGLFKIVDRKIDDGKGSWGESWWLWENDCCYNGGETIKVRAPSDMVESLMNRLESVNPRTLLKIKKVYIRHVRSQFRGSKWIEGFIEGDRRFLENLIVKAYWKWDDVARLSSDGDLVVNGEFIKKLLYVYDVEEAYENKEKS